MKYLAFLSVLVVGLANSQAGGFGGPPPFTNGSPLVSGVDGTYQASVRGNNLSGVIKFTYSAGVQTTTVSGNSWMIFFEGQVYSGVTNVAINNGSLAGVLDTSADTPADEVFAETSNGTTTITTIEAVANPSGYFNGKIDNKSPNGAFKGNGELSYVVTSTTETPPFGTDPADYDLFFDNAATYTISEDFKVKGVRVTFGS
jgi:hypothetical protein